MHDTRSGIYWHRNNRVKGLVIILSNPGKANVHDVNYPINIEQWR